MFLELGHPVTLYHEVPKRVHEDPVEPGDRTMFSLVFTPLRLHLAHFNGL